MDNRDIVLRWTETPVGAAATLVVDGVEIARLEVTLTTWAVRGREGTFKSGTAGSKDFAKVAAVSALEELLSTALVEVRSAMQLSKRPPGWS